MFCDWSVHTKLDHSLAGDQLLDMLDSMFDKSKNMDAQFYEALAGISLPKFQKEILSLLAASFIDLSLMYGPSFIQIVRHLIDDIKGKPVSRRPSSVQKRISKKLADGYRFIADRFYFELENGKYQLVIVVKNISGELRMKNDEGYFEVAWPI